MKSRILYFLLLLFTCNLLRAQPVVNIQCNIATMNYANAFLKISNALKNGVYTKTVRYTDSSGIDSTFFLALSKKYMKAYEHVDANSRSLPFDIYETPGQSLFMQWTYLIIKDKQATYQLQLKVTFEGTVPDHNHVRVQRIEVLAGSEIKPFAQASFEKMLEEMTKPEENIPPPPPPPPSYNKY